IFQRGEPMLYDALAGHTTAKVLIGPWTHTQAALGQGLPADGVPVLNHIALQWFDQYVRGKDVGAGGIPNVTQYVWGLDHFVTAADWPHPRARAVQKFLHADGSLSSSEPAADERARTVLQQPLGGLLCTPSTVQWTAGALGLLPLPCTTQDNLAQILEAKYD